MQIQYKTLPPGDPLFPYVKAFWKLTNPSAEEKPVTIVPDGYFDIIFSTSATEPFHVTLSGLGTGPEQPLIAAHTVMLAVSFKLPATEYLLHTSIASLSDQTIYLPVHFWEIVPDDLQDFEHFCNKVSLKMISALSNDIDNRKAELFQLVYATEGELPIKEMAKTVHWSSRQINRYCQHWFGISLKAYCNILRYRASFKQLREGKLFPEQNFTDQAHFIKAVKRYSGVTPKAIAKDQNDRFIQFSVLPEK